MRPGILAATLVIIIGNAALAIAALWHLSAFTLPEWRIPRFVIPVYALSFLGLAAVALIAALRFQ